MHSFYFWHCDTFVNLYGKKQTWKLPQFTVMMSISTVKSWHIHYHNMLKNLTSKYFCGLVLTEWWRRDYICKNYWPVHLIASPVHLIVNLLHFLCVVIQFFMNPVHFLQVWSMFWEQFIFCESGSFLVSQVHLLWIRFIYSFSCTYMQLIFF